MGGIYLSGDALPEFEFDNTDAKTSLVRSSVSLSLLTLNVGYTLESYSWDKVSSLPFGNGKDDPWDTLQSLSLSGMFGADFNEKLSYIILAGGSASFEEDIDAAYLGGVVGSGFVYSWSENLNVILGAAVAYDDFDEMTPLPAGGIEWNQDAESGFSASLVFPMQAEIRYTSADDTFSASADFLGGSADITYQFSPILGTTLDFSMNGSVYRLDDDSSVIPVGEKKAYVETEGFNVGLMLNYSPNSHINLSVGPYYAFSQELSIRDKDDHSLYKKLEADDAFGGKFMLSFTF
jgi:hypothetical protein